MAKVLLINPPIRENVPPNNPPLGLLYIAAMLEKHGHHCDICDLNGLRGIDQSEGYRERWLTSYKHQYDYVGISGLIVTYHEQRIILEYIKRYHKEFGYPIIILGGGLATSVPEFAFRKHPEIDILVTGEGEYSMLDIVNGVEFKKIPGVSYRPTKPDGIIYSPTIYDTRIQDLDLLPFPAWRKVPMEKVYLKNPIWGQGAGNSSGIDYEMKRSTNMINSRGCPFNCSFCAHYALGRDYRIRSVENVIAEMKKLKELYDVDFIGFVDDNTTANVKWTKAFCEALIREKLDIYWGCSARVTIADGELFRLMYDAGCRWVGFGVESASPRILKAMNKKATPQQAAKAIALARQAGLWANATFIAGYPGETKASLRKTAQFMKANNCLNDMFFAQAYPGTVFYEQEKEYIIEKFGSEDAYIEALRDAKDYVMNFSYISEEILIELRGKAMRGEEF